MAAHTTTTPGDASPVNAFGRRTTAGRHDRGRIEAAIEALIDVLDTMDSDALNHVLSYRTQVPRERA